MAVIQAIVNLGLVLFMAYIFCGYFLNNTDNKFLAILTTALFEFSIFILILIVNSIFGAYIEAS